jgi:hypothetical protein
MIKVCYRVSVLLFFTLSGLIGQTDIYDEWINSLPKPWLISSEELDTLLPLFSERYPKFEDRIRAFALWRIGMPYGEFMLGEEKEPDSDPIIRLDVSDCTVHVLTTLSFIQSDSWTEAKLNMEKIHYRSDIEGNPMVNYNQRWHFTLDRIHSNPYTVDITDEVADKIKLERMDIELNRTAEGSEFLPINWNKHETFEFIPRELVTPDIISEFPAVCGIAFIKKTYFKLGIAVAHEGILIDNRDLIHASSDVGETSKIDIMKYLFGGSGENFNGILVYKFVPIIDQ